MTIAKHSKDLNTQQSQKKQCHFWINNASSLFPAILLASLIGTYLDLYFVGRSVYFFPIRPLPDIFSINIAFTLIGLPLLIGFFLLICHKITAWKKVGFILVLSLFMSIAEKNAEALGFFIHDESWKHIYSFFGYTLYLTGIYSFYDWLTRVRNKGM